MIWTSKFPGLRTKPVLDHMPSRVKALRLNPTTTKEKKLFHLFEDNFYLWAEFQLSISFASSFLSLSLLGPNA